MQLEVPYAMTTDSAYSHLLCSFNQPWLNTMDLHSWHLYVFIFDVLVTNWGPTDRVLFMQTQLVKVLVVQGGKATPTQIDLT